MTDYAKKEQKILNKIGDLIDQLDVTLDKLDEDKDSKVKHFFEQEKAIHEIKQIMRAGRKIEENKEEAIDEAAYEVTDWMENEESLLGEIERHFNKLTETLDHLTVDDNKVKSYVEQKKVIHEVKKITDSVDKLVK